MTTFGFRVCVTTLLDDISIRTTKPLAAASVVKQKNLFSFQNKPKPNAGAWHKSQRPHVSWRNVVQLEPSCSSPLPVCPHPRSHPGNDKKPCMSLLFTTEQCTPTAPLAATKNPPGPETQSSAATQGECWDNLAILGFRAGHRLCLNRITQFLSITSAKS